MGFHKRLAKIRKQKNIGFPDLARLTAIHATQLRRYERGESSPTLDALKKLAIALNVPGDMLLFDEDERQAPDYFFTQFENLKRFDSEEKKIAKAVLDGLVLRHQAKVLMNKE